MGLHYNASLSEIKKGYYNLSKQYHPDINPSEEAHRKFIEINEAYEILTRLKSLLTSPYSAKNVTKEWVKNQQSSLRNTTINKTIRRRSKREVSKELKAKMFKSDVFKIVRAYLYTLVFFGLLGMLAYLSQTEDNDLPVKPF